MGRPSKVYWDERSKKLNRKKRKNKKRIKYNGKRKDTKRYQYSPDYVITLPLKFSLIDHLEETTQFFEKTINKFKNTMPKSDFLFEATNVEEVTPDAIMYLIALMRNYKETKRRMYSFHGNYPKDEKAKKVFLESGFLNFVRSKSKNLPENSSKMEIKSGKNSDSISAGNICNFVSERLNVPVNNVKDLYEVVVEMMSNVYYHAYSNKEINMVPEWYMYAECSKGVVKFLFLDTGIGIAKTVQKHSVYEKVVNKIGFGSDANLIKSALEGDFRTQTYKDNHGRGLPFIKEFASSKGISNFNIISGKGHCKIDSNGDIMAKDLKSNICGTVYSFSISKEEIL